MTLPGNIPVSSLRMDGYTGPQGARGKAFTSSIASDHSVSFVCTQPLLPSEGFTLVISWPKGYIQEPSAGTRFRYFLEDNRPTLVGAAGLLVVLLYYVIVWLLVGRDPPKASIMPIYEPPDGISPAAMRYLVRMAFDDKIFTVAILDMAVKNYLSIKETGGTYTLKRTNAAKQALTAEESALAPKLFRKQSRNNDEADEAGHAATEIKLQPKNHAILNESITALKKALRAAEDKIYFVTNQRYLIPGVIFSVATLGGMAAAEAGDRRFILGFFCVWLTGWGTAVFFLVRQSLNLWKGARAARSTNPKLVKQARSSTLFALPFVAAEIVALVVLGWLSSVLVLSILFAFVGINLAFHWLLKVPTAAGRQLLDKIAGFRMFLRAVDGDRLNRLVPPDKTPALFEKYLPYAVALDCEQAWAQQFSAVLEDARQTTGYSSTWYVGSRDFAMNAFAFSLGGSFSNAIAASLSTPGTSSGTVGAGFSGGGGGGGGGGGW